MVMWRVFWCVCRQSHGGSLQPRRRRVPRHVRRRCVRASTSGGKVECVVGVWDVPVWWHVAAVCMGFLLFVDCFPYPGHGVMLGVPDLTPPCCVAVDADVLGMDAPVLRRRGLQDYHPEPVPSPQQHQEEHKNNQGEHQNNRGNRHNGRNQNERRNSQRQRSSRNNRRGRRDLRDISA